MTLFSLTGLTVALAFGTALARPAFHPPHSMAEHTLALILKLDQQKPDQVDPVFPTSGRRPRLAPRQGAPYLRYMTVALAAAILAEEAREVRVNCGGVYRSDEECGMDADAIICGQDFPDIYLFRTTLGRPTLAVVEAAWPPDRGAQPATSAAYRLKRIGHTWKIDGVSCRGGGAYNWRR